MSYSPTRTFLPADDLSAYLALTTNPMITQNEPTIIKLPEFCVKGPVTIHNSATTMKAPPERKNLFIVCLVIWIIPSINQGCTAYSNIRMSRGLVHIKDCLKFPFTNPARGFSFLTQNIPIPDTHYSFEMTVYFVAESIDNFGVTEEGQKSNDWLWRIRQPFSPYRSKTSERCQDHVKGGSKSMGDGGVKTGGLGDYRGRTIQGGLVPDSRVCSIPNVEEINPDEEKAPAGDQVGWDDPGRVVVTITSPGWRTGNGPREIPSCTCSPGSGSRCGP